MLYMFVSELIYVGSSQKYEMRARNWAPSQTLFFLICLSTFVKLRSTVSQITPSGDRIKGRRYLLLAFRKSKRGTTLSLMVTVFVSQHKMNTQQFILHKQ